MMTEGQIELAKVLVNDIDGGMYPTPTARVYAIAYIIGQFVDTERARCLAILDRYAAYEGEDDPFDLVAAAIRQPSLSHAAQEGTDQ